MGHKKNLSGVSLKAVNQGFVTDEKESCGSCRRVQILLGVWESCWDSNISVECIEEG